MWTKVKEWCFNSEVIAWSYIQFLAGIIGFVWTGVQGVDLSPLITNPKYLTLWMVFNGAVTAYLRFRRAQHDGDGGLR